MTNPERLTAEQINQILFRNDIDAPSRKTVRILCEMALASLSPAADVECSVCKSRKHDGQFCKDDEHARSVCEGTYSDRTDEVLGLVEALQAIGTLCAGHSEHSKQITKIVEDAIEEHAHWTK